MDSRANNFDALRLLGALLVAVSHTWHIFLGDKVAVSPFPFQSLGGIGVNLFCVISGYLITQSRLRNTGWDFTKSRVLRIVPGLAAAVLLFAFVLGPWQTVLSRGAYFGSGQTWRFLGGMLVIPWNDTLPGTFSNGAVIGQIYTLTPEVLFYLLVGISGTKPNIAWTVIPLLAIVSTFLIVDSYQPLPLAPVYFLKLGGMALFTYPVHLATICVFYLLMGSAIALAKPELYLRRFTVVFAIVWLAASFQKSPHVYNVIEMVFFPLLVLGIGCTQRWALRIPKWFGDISYGTYLYHFAIAQTLVTIAPWWRTPSGVAGAIVISAAAGWASFHLVEKRALAWKPRRTARAILDLSVTEQAALAG